MLTRAKARGASDCVREKQRGIGRKGKKVQDALTGGVSSLAAQGKGKGAAVCAGPDWARGAGERADVGATGLGRS